MTRLQKLRIGIASFFDRMFPVTYEITGDPDVWDRNLENRFNDIFDDFENIKLEQQRYSYFTQTLGDQITALKSENALMKKELAVCMRLIKHQHSLINGFKITSINPSRN